MGEEAAHDTTRRLSDVIPGRFGDPVSVQYAWMSPENAEAMPTRPLFLALHGWGSNERDIAGIMQYIAPYNDVVSLRAPLVLHAPEGVSAGAYSWFHDAVPSGDDLDHDIAAAARAVDQWVDGHIPATRDVVPIGFSQGGAVAVHLLRMHGVDLHAGEGENVLDDKRESCEIGEIGNRGAMGLHRCCPSGGAEHAAAGWV